MVVNKYLRYMEEIYPPTALGPVRLVRLDKCCTASEVGKPFNRYLSKPHAGVILYTGQGLIVSRC